MHLQADRSLEFHTPQGCHYTTRLPRYGRDLKFDKRAAEALIPAAGVNEAGNGEAFRLNLESGRFLRAYEIDVGGDDLASAGGGALQGGVTTGCVNAAAIAEQTHGLLAFGTSKGTVELWDPRSKSRIGLLSRPSRMDILDGKEEITALEFDHTGLGMASGSSSGIVRLYDLRSPHPILKKDQGYGFPIQDIIYLTTSNSRLDPKILTADKRIIKIWDSQNGSPWTAVEPAVDLNSVAWCKDSGMLLTANEGRQQHSFFIPQLGPAPRWCSFLDNLVEEMAEDPDDPNAFMGQKAGSIYDNYKFLTTDQLETLNLSHLIGTTSLLRPYMHGYFVAQRLYEEAKMISDPFVWEEERNKRVKEKIDLERESRIRGTKRTTAKVNRHLAEKLLQRQEREERNQARKALQNNAEPKDTLLSDPRFSKLFEDEAYAIDETSREFQSLNPSTAPRVDVDRKLTAVEEEALMDIPSSDSDASSRASSGNLSTNGPSLNRSKSDQNPRMQVSYSQKPEESRDRSFGARTKDKKAPKGPVKAMVKEREVTFMPKKERTSDKKPTKQRRSASGNVFRNL